MIMVALTCAFIKETSQSKQLNWHHYLYHMLMKNKDNSNQEKHVVFLVQFQSTVSGSNFLVRWVMSLPSVWRSSVARSWTSVTITWSIAIAGSGSKNWIDSVERVQRFYLLELSGASKSLYFFFFFSFLSFLSFFSFFFFSFRGGDGTGDSYPSPVFSSAD